MTDQQHVPEKAHDDAAQIAELRRRTTGIARVILVLVALTVAVTLTTAVAEGPERLWSWSSLSTLLLSVALACVAISLLRRPGR